MLQQRKWHNFDVSQNFTVPMKDSKCNDVLRRQMHYVCSGIMSTHMRILAGLTSMLLCVVPLHHAMVLFRHAEYTSSLLGWLDALQKLLGLFTMTLRMLL